MKAKNKSTIKNLTVKSKTENLSRIRDYISEAANKLYLSSDLTENIMLAVDEACTNIIKHAYKSFPDGEITLKIEFSPKEFKVIIRDNGTPFNSDSIPDPDLKEYYRQHRVGGLGMYLMKSLMDEVKYELVSGKYNQVSLTKYLNGK